MEIFFEPALGPDNNVGFFDNINDLIWAEEENHFIYSARRMSYINFLPKFGTRERLPPFWKNVVPNNCETAVFLLKDAEIFYKKNSHGGFDIHRDFDKPAFICYSSARFWYRQGKIHRGGGNPAYINIAQQTFYFAEDGSLHREGGYPALKTKNGYSYFVKGKKHREDGPAVGGKFFLNDVELTEEEFYSQKI